mmetsp:Transcript_11926/g.27849  ORF Transcript_11926/g.27849 Transcript_11926/m.27849 type:complete len:230 (-) Transcript_11926:597-1286(-)
MRNLLLNLNRLPVICLLALVLLNNSCEALLIAPAASGAWTWYKSMLVAQPLVTKSLTSSCIMGVSDVMCQKVVARATPEEERPSKLDSIRILHVAITGSVWSGPVTHYWYIILEKMYGAIAKAANIQDPVIGLVIKLILDSTIFSSVTISGYFTVRSILEGTGFKGASEKVRTRFLTTLFGAWKFWPLANAINFWFVPMQFRVLYMNVLSLFWTGWLTFVNSKKIAVDN